jgi:hypothetical protein
VRYTQEAQASKKWEGIKMGFNYSHGLLQCNKIAYASVIKLRQAGKPQYRLLPPVSLSGKGGCCIFSVLRKLLEHAFHLVYLDGV